MPNLKDLRNRIGSVKNTRKITTAMKMVAAGKLRRAQEQAVLGGDPEGLVRGLGCAAVCSSDGADALPRCGKLHA